MKRKKKKLKKIKSIKLKKFKSKISAKRRKKITKRKSRIKRIIKKKGKTKSRKKKTTPSKFKNKKTQKTRAVVSGILSFSDKLRSILRFNFNLDKSLQKFFQGISNRVSNIKKVIQEEREKQKKIKIQAMKREKIEAQKRFKQQEELAIKAKALELREEEKLGRERKREVQKFIRLEQAAFRYRDLVVFQLQIVKNFHSAHRTRDYIYS